MRTEVEYVEEKIQPAFKRTVFISNDGEKYYSEKQALDRDKELERREVLRNWPCLDTPSFLGYLVRSQEECNNLALLLRQRENAVESFPALVWWENNENGRDFFECLDILKMLEAIETLLEEE